MTTRSLLVLSTGVAIGALLATSGTGQGVAAKGPGRIAVLGANGDVTLDSISATSASDIWVTGSVQGAGAIIEHYDGTAWTATQGADRTAAIDQVDAISPDDVWAVGQVLRDGVVQPFAERYDGSTWTELPLPDIDGVLSGVSGSGPDDVWMTIDNPLGGVGHALHWTGSRFVESRMADSPWGPGTYFAVADIDARHQLAVGGRLGVYDVGMFAATGNGKRWIAAPYQDPEPRLADILVSVAGVAPRRAWSVGYVISGRHRGYGYIEQWDGASWKLADWPVVNESQLLGVAAVSADDAWAVGGSGRLRGQLGPNLAVHWDGATWTAVPTVTVGHTKNGRFEAVTSTAPDQVWAVGTTTRRDGGIVSYVERWDGHRCTVLARFTPSSR